MASWSKTRGDPPGEESRPNLLLCRPERLVDAEVDEDGAVTVLRPRFIKGPLARWLQPRLGRPFYRVHLDEIGSFVWQQIDGQTTVGQIAQAMEQHFGERVDPAVDRLELFITHLVTGGMALLHLPDE